MSSNSPTNPPSRRARLRRFLARTLFVLACLATVTAAIYLEEKIRGRAAWHSYEAEAGLRGTKLEFADYIPPKIPDAENFASIPLFEEVFRYWDTSTPLAYPARPDPYPLTLPPLPSQKDKPGGGLPPLSDPSMQKRIDLAVWQKYAAEVKLLPAAGESAAADTLAALDRFAPLLAQLHEAGLRPRCRFPLHWEQGYETALPHLQVLMSAAKFRALRMAAHLELGHSAEAYEEWHDGFRMIKVTAKEPAYITALVRMSCTTILAHGLWSGLAAHQWAEPELRKIEADLAQLDWLGDYVFALGSERGAVNFIADRLIDRPEERARIMSLMATMREYPGPPTMAKVAWKFYPTGWFYHGKVKVNQYFDELIPRVDPASRRCFLDRPVPTSPKNFQSPIKRSYYSLFVTAIPVFQGMETRFIWTATLVDHARLACALERFRIARGAFPEALSELTPGFLPGMPAEIVNGEPYRYRRTENGAFVLYSVGLNLQDDGGVVDPAIKSPHEQPDWVWRTPEIGK